MFKYICTKELKLYFRKPTAFIFFGVFFMSAAFRFIENMLNFNADIQSLFSQYSGFLWIVIPLLSVGLIPAEKCTKTDRLLATSPISSCGIVFGKYLASLIVFTIALLSTILFTIIFIIHAKPEFMIILNSYFALFMYGSAILSIGLFFGAVLKNTALGMLATTGFLVFTNQIPMLKMIENFPVWLSKIVSFLAVNEKYNAFFGAQVSPEAFVYFLSLTVIFLISTVMAVENKKCN